jgi:hypothetical protein
MGILANKGDPAVDAKAQAEGTNANDATAAAVLTPSARPPRAIEEGSHVVVQDSISREDVQRIVREVTGEDFPDDQFDRLGQVGRVEGLYEGGPDGIRMVHIDYGSDEFHWPADVVTIVSDCTNFDSVFCAKPCIFNIQYSIFNILYFLKFYFKISPVRTSRGRSSSNPTSECRGGRVDL